MELFKTKNKKNSSLLIESYIRFRKIFLLSTAILLLLTGLMQGLSFAQASPPAILGYQGRLYDSSDNLETGTFCLKFSIYDASSGGNKLWPAGAPSAQEVTVSNGVFSTGIGDTSAGGDALNFSFIDSNNYYLNVEIAEQVGGACTGGDESFETVSTRQQLYASAFAQNAQYLHSSAAEDTERARFSDTTNADSVSIYVGDGSPNGLLSAERGSIFLDQSGGFYVNTSAGGSGTTWTDIASGGASSALSAITDATGDKTLSNGSNNITWNWQLDGAESALTIGESAASINGSNDQFLLNVNSVVGSTATPLYVKNLGNGRSFQVDDVANDTTPFVIDADGNVGIGDPTPNALLTVGSSDAFQVNSSGAITAATGITSSGTITFSGLSDGFIKATSGVLSGGNSIDLTADVTGILPIANGGTGATTLNDLITLATHTTGNYVATLADAGNGFFAIANSGTEDSGVTIDIANDSIDLAQLADALTLDSATLTFDDGTNTLLTLTDAGTTGNLAITGDLTVSGDDIFLGTNTSGYILVADGTNYNPVAVSGDITINSSGVTAIAADSVALGTDTTGNYVATLTDAGNSFFTITNGTAEGGAATIDIANDSINLTELADTLALDADLAFTAGAAEEITVNKTYTDGTGENGFVLNFTGADTGAGTTAQYGLYLDNIASTEGLDALIVLDNSDTDDAVGAAFKTVDAGGGFTNLFDIGGTLISSAEFTVLDGGIDVSSEVSGTLPVSNGGTGATTLNDLITLGTHTTGNYVATIADAGSSIFTVTGSGSETATVTLDIVANSIGNTQLEYDTGQALTTSSSPTFAGLDISGVIQAGSGNENITLASGKIDADAIGLISSDGVGSTSSGSGLETDTDRLGLLQGCSDGQILKWTEATSVWGCAADASGGGGGTLQDAYGNGATITTTDGKDIAFTLSDTTTDSDFSVLIADDSTSTVSISRENGSDNSGPAQLLWLTNLDTTFTQAIGLKIDSSGGAITTAIDVSDSDIDTALSAGANTIAITTGTIGSNAGTAIDFAEFDVSGATGSITIDDDGNAGSISIEGTVLDINSLDFTGAGTITTGGTFALNPGGAVTLGDGGDTLEINTSDWDISTTGTLTGISFDANGTGNSISNIDLTTDIIGTLPVANGGTGTTTLTSNGILIGNGTSAITATTLTNGQLLIGSTGVAPVAATLSGTTNQISVATGAGSITLSTPQNINTSADVQFGSLTLASDETITNAVDGSIVLTDSGSSQTLTFDISASDPTISTSTGGLLITLGGSAGDDFNIDSNTFVVEGDENRVGVGTDDPIGKLTVEDTGLTGGASQIYGTTSQLGISSGTQSTGAYGTASTFEITGSAIASGGVGASPAGALGIFSHASTGTVAMGSGSVGVFNANSAINFGTVSTAIGTGGLVLISPETTGGTITDAASLYAYSAIDAGAGSITNNYGLLVKDQTAGSSDFGVAIEGADTQALWISSGADNTDAANGIAFGSSRDTNLYRSAADTLKTDDSFAIGGTNLTFDSNGTITTGGTFTLTPGGAVTLGDGGDTLTIDTSDWDISATGEITGVSFDANGTGNSISNIDNSDLTNDTIDLDKVADTLTLDADLAFTAGAAEEITVNKTYTDGTGENGFVLNFTGADTGAGTTAQYGLYLDNVASTEGLDALIVLDNSDTDDAVGAAFKTIDAGGGFTNLFDIGGTLISSAEFTVLDGGIDISSEVSGVLPIANGGTNKALTLSAGGIAYFDADSFEVLSAGSSGQVLTSGGAGTPVWVTQGAGGGLDADTLDSISSGSFLRSDTADIVTAGGITFNSDISAYFGTTSEAAILWDTAATSPYLSTVLSGSNNWIINADDDTDWGHGDSTNPTLFIQSADALTTADYISFFHDQTNGNIAVGAGDLVLSPATGIVEGTSALTLQAGGSNQDLSLKSSGTGTVNILPGTDSTTAIQLQKADGTNILNVDSTNARIGIGNSAPDSVLHITGSVGGTDTGANAIAGIKTSLTINPSGGGFQFGNRTEVTVSNTASATQAVGDFIRVTDSTALANTVRGLEIQAYSGTNTAGTNAGLTAFGKTFGVQGITTGLAGAVSEPAGVYGELQHATNGNAIRAYSANITGGTLVKFYQEDTTFSGTGLLMDFGNDTGSFTGDFITLTNASAPSNPKFNVDSAGKVTIQNTDAANTDALYIDTQESGVRDTFVIESDVTSPNTVKARFQSDGSLFVSLTGTTQTERLCWDGTGGTNEEIVDCTGSPGDLAENFGTLDSSIEAGDVVVAIGEAEEVVVDGLLTSKAWVRKTTQPYEGSVVGVISTQPNELYADNVFTEDENPRPVTLAGRVPVKVNLENGPIVTGDLLTSSSEPGVAMKATEAGMVLGQALASYDGSSGSNKIIAFIAPFYYNPGTLGQEILLDTETTGFLVNQSGSGNLLQLQNNGIDNFLVRNNGTVEINTSVADPETKLVVVKNGDSEVFSINARGDALFSGLLILPDDTFAGSIVTDANGEATIEFSHHVGTGKPVVQLTPESTTPIFTQIASFTQDNDENYTGFILQARNQAGITQAGVIIHYLVIGKQVGYETVGLTESNPIVVQQNAQPIYNLQSGGGGSVAGAEDNTEDVTSENTGTEEGSVEEKVEENTEEVVEEDVSTGESATEETSETDSSQNGQEDSGDTNDVSGDESNAVTDNGNTDVVSQENEPAETPQPEPAQEPTPTPAPTPEPEVVPEPVSEPAPQPEPVSTPEPPSTPEEN